MVSLTGAERKVSRLVKDLDIDELYDRLERLRGYADELSASLGTSARQQFERARDIASEAAHDAEEAMKDNLAASLILAVGLGLVVGYFIGRRRQ